MPLRYNAAQGIQFSIVDTNFEGEIQETPIYKLEMYCDIVLDKSRDEFIARLHAAVKWMNTHRAKQLWYLSTNQKERCEDCLAQDPRGGRTKW